MSTPLHQFTIRILQLPVSFFDRLNQYFAKRHDGRNSYNPSFCNLLKDLDEACIVDRVFLHKVDNRCGIVPRRRTPESASETDIMADGPTRCVIRSHISGHPSFPRSFFRDRGVP